MPRKMRPPAKKRTTTRKRYTRRRVPRSNPLLKYIETKKKEETWTENAIASAGILYKDQCMQLAQGDTYSTFTGHNVNGVGFKSRFLLHNNAAIPMFVRYLVLVNKSGSSNVGYRTGASLFEGQNGDLSLGAFTDSSYLYRRLNTDQYTVLVDRVIRMGSVNDKDKIFMWKRYIPLKLRKFRYNGTNTLPTLGNIVELWLTGEANLDDTAQVVECSGESTFYYKDA